MYYLKNCAICGRTGSVADAKDDEICKNCKYTEGVTRTSRSVEVKLEKKKENKIPEEN